MANHWTTYHKDKVSGDLCKYASAAFMGPLNDNTVFLDGKGRIKMETFDPAWMKVAI